MTFIELHVGITSIFVNTDMIAQIRNEAGHREHPVWVAFDRNGNSLGKFTFGFDPGRLTALAIIPAASDASALIIFASLLNDEEHDAVLDIYVVRQRIIAWYVKEQGPYAIPIFLEDYDEDFQRLNILHEQPGGRLTDPFNTTYRSLDAAIEDIKTRTPHKTVKIELALDEHDVVRTNRVDA